MKTKGSIERIIMSRFIGVSIGVWLVIFALEFLVSFTTRNYHAFGTELTFAELAFVPIDERMGMAQPYLAESVTASAIWVLVTAAVYFAGIRIFGRGISRKIATPARNMAAGFAEVAGGNLDVVLDFQTETEFREMRDAFNAMALRLKKSEEQRLIMENERMRLFSHIAHDLKTPMTTISSYAGALANDVVNPDKQQEYFLAIQAKSMQLNQLIEQLLSYSKMGASDYRINCEQTDIDELLRLACTSLFGEIESKKMELELNLPDAPVYLNVDSLELNRAITNLLSNAIRYNPVGSLLAVGLAEEANRVMIQIADNGSEIPADIADKLFEPFVSGSVSRSSGSGSGLGLAIVKKIIERHGGEISVENAPAPYTKMFVIRLPRKADA